MNKKKTVLYVSTKEISLLDIPRALDEMGYDVYRAALGTKMVGYHQQDVTELIKVIQDIAPNYVISYDFGESIAQACLETDCVYVSWVYDAPQKELYTPYAQYPCNYIFVFDEMQQRRLKDIGLKNVFHIPLGIHAKKVMTSLTRKYDDNIYEIGFVGQLYKNEAIEQAISKMPGDIYNELQATIDNLILKWNVDTHLHGCLGEKNICFWGGHDGHIVLKKYPYMTEQFYYEAAVVSRLLANRERLSILNCLAEKYNVSLFTFDKQIAGLSSRVNVYPGALYDTEVSSLYRNTKINLNITLHCIETGACQRVFDIMAAGGFLISNYQKELEELFIPGEEIILYHNIEELVNYVDYYLKHDEEREKIAQRGQKKVLKEHDFHDKMKVVFTVVDSIECKREKEYLTIQKEQLEIQSNELLKTKREVDYVRLSKLYKRNEYETIIEKNIELMHLKEMILCWTRCLDEEKKYVFEDVDSIMQAEEKYHKILINTCNVNILTESGYQLKACDFILNHNTILFLITWVIFKNTDDFLIYFELLVQNLEMVNLMTALAFISYALVWTSEDKLLLYKANLLMELNDWKEALEVLKAIKKPSDEIQMLCRELQETLE